MKGMMILLGCLSLGMAHAQVTPAPQKADTNNYRRVGVNTGTPQASMDIKEQLNGGNPVDGKLQGLSLPNFTTEQRDKMGAGQTESMKIGTLIYNTTEKCIQKYLGYYDGAHQWSCNLSEKGATPNAQKKDTSFGKRVGVNTATPQASVDIVEHLQGDNPVDGRLQGLSLPNFTTEQRDKMGAGQTESMKIGTLIYNTTEKCIQKYLGYYDGAHQWSCNLSEKGATPNAQKKDTSFGKRVGINTKAPQASMDIAELLEGGNPVDGKLQGLSLPNFTTEQRNKFGAGQTESMKIGTLIYNTTEKCIEMYQGYYNGAHQWSCDWGGDTGLYALSNTCGTDSQLRGAKRVVVTGTGVSQVVLYQGTSGTTQAEIMSKLRQIKEKGYENLVITTTERYQYPETSSRWVCPPGAWPIIPSAVAYGCENDYTIQHEALSISATLEIYYTGRMLWGTRDVTNTCKLVVKN